MDNKTCELVQMLMNANEKLEKEVKFLRNRKSELDKEIKIYIEKNDRLFKQAEEHRHIFFSMRDILEEKTNHINDLERVIENMGKELNKKYWEGVARGQQQAIEEQRDNNFDKQAEYLKGYKEGTAAVFEIWNRVRAK